ncbi:tannase/feruloyl esterase family alpha/beta hydrolase [Ewingella americana]|uniref:Tannase/feruloyl esterase family alpha/beta hydrolase n=1 Tax=Ewingella americana TaxID=41202 RepID=A0A502G8U2_9GAMM|nr:tannase/feruloyl esterase family alpha/beta hydrolase [Ewingella americana]TPG58348.1 tannase/feruloyl esterase family alpha/beta hydrolase [Ewingella americana]
MRIIPSLCGVALILLTSNSVAEQRKTFSETDCLAMKQIHIGASQIGLPTNGAVITAAAMVGQASERHCQLEGAIKPVDSSAPDINVQINLPLIWNGKALHLGGSGFNGAVRKTDTARFSPVATPGVLKQGYATFGSDSGHQGGISDASFALNNGAWKNFTGLQLKKTHDLAIAMIQQAYGSKPKHMYFQGNSQGGHEALAVIQHYPQDYDGVIAIHPVYNFIELHVAGSLLGQAMYNTPDAWISPAKAALISNAVYAVCDQLDGLSDGVIANIKACDKTFRLEGLRCSGGTDSGPTCLSDVQMSLVRKMTRPQPLGVTLPTGDHFASWPILQGADAPTLISMFGTGINKSKTIAAAELNGQTGPQPGTAPAPANLIMSFPYIMGDQVVRYAVTQDATYDTLSFNPASYQARLQELASQADDADPDIRVFEQHGGKLLLMHGSIDMSVPPANTIAYYEKLQAQFGNAALHQFVRFYIAPGFAHNTGPFPMSWDSLGTLDNWVDKGIAPGPQTIIDTHSATAGRELPLCEFPSYPKYQGHGNKNSASSFSCVTE